jgi:hypothetical protein
MRWGIRRSPTAGSWRDREQLIVRIAEDNRDWLHPDQELWFAKTKTRPFLRLSDMRRSGYAEPWSLGSSESFGY